MGNKKLSKKMVYVHEHTKEDGTKVSSYYRTVPLSTKRNK